LAWAELDDAASKETTKMAIEAPLQLPPSAMGVDTTPPMPVAGNSSAKPSPKSPFHFGEGATVPAPPPKAKQTPTQTIDKATDAGLLSSYKDAYDTFNDYKEAADGLPKRLLDIEHSKAKLSEKQKATQKNDAMRHVELLRKTAEQKGPENLQHQESIAGLRATRAANAKRDLDKAGPADKPAAQEKYDAAKAEWGLSLKLVGDSEKLNDAIKAY
jgi:hypothetical protein